MARRDVLLAVVAACIAVSAPRIGNAQILRLTRLGGIVEVGADIRRQDFDNGGSGDRSLDRNRFEQRLGLDASGYLGSPDAAALSLSTTVGLRQELSDSSDGGASSEVGPLLRYAGRLDLFPRSPVSLGVFANRYDDTAPQAFGMDTESNGDTLGATLRLGLRVLPSSLTWQRVRSETRALGSGISTKRDDTRRLIEFSGQRFTDNWNVSVVARDEDVDDRSEPAIGDSRNRDANVGFGYRWGGDLDKSWQLRGRWFDRDGRFDFTSASVSNTFGWEITDRLESSLEHDFNRFDSDGSRTTTHQAGLSVQHLLYESLRTRLRLFGNDSERDIGRQSGYGGSLGLRYTKQLPWSSRLRADADAHYRVDRTDFDVGEASVSNEPILVTGFDEDLFLANDRIDESTIVVFLARDGRCPGTEELRPDFDYFVENFGVRTSLRVPSGGLVAVGDLLCVDYSYQVDPDATIGTPRFHFGIGWDAGWIRIGYDHDRSRDRELSGEATLLDDSTRDAVDLELRGDRGPIRASAGARYIRDRNVGLDYDEFGLRQSLGWRLARGLDLSLQLAQSRRNFDHPDRRTDLISAGASFAWVLRSDRRIRFFGLWRTLDDSESKDQQDLEVGVTGTVRLARIELLPLLRWTRSRRGGSESRELAAVLRIRRRF